MRQNGRLIRGEQITLSRNFFFKIAFVFTAAEVASVSCLTRDCARYEISVDRQTDRHTDVHRTLAAHARRGLIITHAIDSPIFGHHQFSDAFAKSTIIFRVKL